MNDTVAANDRPRVFISYALEDASAARLIQGALSKDFEVRTDLGQTVAGSPWASNLLKAVASTDMVVVLLSEAATRAEGARTEAQVLASEAKRRDIDIVPVLLEQTAIPPALKDRVPVDLSEEGARGVGRLLVRLQGQSAIDFRKLSPELFERMAMDLLRAEGFDLDLAGPRGSARPYDFIGTRGTERWIVEVKHYSKSRISVNVIHDVIRRLTHTALSNTSALLVTSAQLTSVAQAYLREIDTEARVEILDGLALEQIVLKHPSILERYFSFSGYGELW